MSELKKLRPINKAELAAKGVVALGDRPNTRQQYGVGGLTAAELKKWFDGLSVFLAEKINELQSTLAAPDAADYIPLEKPIGEIKTLGDMIRAFDSGLFASAVMRAALPGFIDGNAVMQTILNKIAEEIGGNNTDIETLFAKSGAEITSELDTATQVITIILKNARGETVSTHEIDLRVTTERLIDAAVTTPKIADNAVTTPKLADGAVTAPKVANGAVTTEKIANSAVTEDKMAPAHLRRVQALEVGAFQDVAYNEETGELTFTSKTGEKKVVDLPLEEILSDVYFSEGTANEDTDDALVFVFANGREIRVPTSTMLSDLLKYVQGIHDSIYVLQKAPPLAVMNKAILLPTPTIGMIAAEQEGGF